MAILFFHASLKDEEVRSLIRRGIIKLGANKKLRIYGRLNCHSGKKMKRQNRIFFSNSREAESLAYRPCSHCMHNQYQQWKNEISRIKNNPIVAA